MYKKLILSSFIMSISINSSADSFQLSADGSSAISNGALEVSSGALQLVTGVLSVPVTVTGATANWSTEQRSEAGNIGDAPLPIADEIVRFSDVTN